MHFIRRLKIFYLFKPEISMLDNKRYVSHDKIQNFNSITLILCLVDHKNTGTWGVNNNI